MEPPSGNGSTPETYHRGRGRRLALTGLAAGLAIAYALVRWRPFRIEIAGSSMAPALRPGDWALAVASRRLRRGDVVVIEHPRRPGLELVKRIVAAPEELAPNGVVLEADEWWVEGDAGADSTDSRHFGPVRTDAVRATVRLVYSPPSRRRLV